MTDSTTSPARSEEARSGSPLIIGIGASAGGLEALQQFFQHMPGNSGIKVVKEHGGLVIVQDPETAKFDGMPRSVINTGLADFVLSPDEIVDEILNFSNYPTLIKAHGRETMLTDEETFVQIYAILKKISGIDFTNYKRTTVLRRIERRMVVTHCTSITDYVALLGSGPDEANILVKEILIGVTNFFRDPSFFEKLKYNAVYNIVERADEKDPIRVWSAGCSTGEEAYSLAILFHEVLEEKNLRRDIKIFATDVDAKAIEQAGRGVFPESIADDVSAERLAVTPEQPAVFNVDGDALPVDGDLDISVISPKTPVYIGDMSLLK